jgi:hypothetical protein
VSNSEDILNKLDIKANPKRLQMKRHIEEYDIDTEVGKESKKSISKAEL